MTLDPEAADARPNAALAVLRRVPFTTAVVLTVLVVGIATGALWRRVTEFSWYPDIAYGVPALQEGKWWTPVSGWFFGLSPAQYIAITIGFAVVVGYCEWRLGSVRTAMVCVCGQLIGILGGSLLIWALSHTEMDWAARLAEQRDVGFTTAMVAAVAAASATLRSPWRLRVRAVLIGYVVIAFLFEGKLADVQHLIAAAVFLPIGERYFSTDERGFLPRTRREVRLLAVVGLWVIAIVQVAVFFFPSAGPLGDTEHERGTVGSMIVAVAIAVLLADQLRKGRRWAWWVTVVFASITVLATLAALVLVLTVDDATTGAVTLGGGLLWACLLALLISSRQAFRVPIRRKVKGGALAGRDEGEAVRELLARHGGSTMSWMTTWPENKHYFTEDGESYLAYQRHAGAVIALADPVGPEGSLPETVAAFTAMCEGTGLVPCFFSTTAAVADAAAAQGWRSVQIAEDTLIDLPELEFKGKAWQDVRSAINKAGKDGIEFRMVALAEESFAVRAQVRAISEEWVGDKGLPEMGFTLGGMEEAMDPHVRVGLAVDADGSVHGVTSWLPVFGADGTVRGWTLDVMRRRQDGFRPVIEFLLASACLAFKEDGAEFVSLSGAPLARSDGDDAESDAIDKLLETLGAAMEPYYGFRSLHSFKAKFKPRYDPVYMSYRDEADLPRIGIALTRAYLPTASARDLVKMTVSKP